MLLRLPRFALVVLACAFVASAIATTRARADVLDFLPPLGATPAAHVAAPEGAIASAVATAERVSRFKHGTASPAEATMLAGSPTWSFETNVGSTSMGRWPTTAGDVNGDGYSDMITLGSAGLSDALYLFFGSPSGFSLAPGFPITVTSRNNGAASPAGDVNGDGYDDVALTFSTGTAGYLRIYYGTATGLNPAYFEYFQNFSPFWGQVVGCAGDVNGDGYSDVIVGSPSEGTWINCGGSGGSQGRVDVFYGSASGIAGPANWILWGCQWASNAQMGSSAAAAGDVNADGYDDIVVGAPGAGTIGDTTPAGSIWVVYGSATGLPILNGYANVGTLGGATTIHSPAHFASFGASACSAGDVNGDGYADVAVGAPYDDTGATDSGIARVYAGSATGLQAGTVLWYEYTVTANSHFGLTLAPAGDINGDGRGDLLVGESSRIDVAQSYAGSLFINRLVPTSYPGSVATAGDLNGDGISEVVFGDYSFSNGQTAEGHIQVYAGSGDGPATYPAWSFTTIYDNPNLGWSVASAGDVNGDGLDDVLIGSPTWANLTTPTDVDNGAVFLFMGNYNGLAANPNWYTTGVAHDQLGICVSGVGDVNGDGYADFAAGAHQYNNGNGKTCVWYGHAAGPGATPDQVLYGPSYNSLFGNAVSGGDFNGDGYADVVVGAPWHDGNTGSPFFQTIADGGGAFMYLGGASGLAPANVWAAQGGQANEHFGQSLNGFADINGDGYTDLVVGSPGLDIGSPFSVLDCGRITEFDGGSTASVLAFRQTIDGQTNETFGSCVSNAGDVNGDGYGDVIVGAPNAAPAISGQGRAAVFAGSGSGLVPAALWSQLGTEAFGAFGSSVASAGDVNGDGLSDVLVGAVFQDDAGASDRGTARIFAGPLPAAAAAIWIARGPSTYANMGHALANLGDINGDGWSDLAFGEPGYDGSGYRQGRVEVMLGEYGDSRLDLSFARRAVNGPNIVPMGSAPAGSGILSYHPAPAGRSRFKLQWDIPTAAALPGASLSGSSPTWTSTLMSVRGHLGAAYIPLAGMQTGVPYSWRVRAKYRNPYFPSSRWISPTRSGVREYDLRAPGNWVDVPSHTGAPSRLALSEASPNPAHDASNVSFDLPQAGRVTLEVVDVQGRQVRELVTGTRAAGRYHVSWDGRDAAGHAANAGVYFYRLSAGGAQATRKVALVR